MVVPPRWQRILTVWRYERCRGGAEILLRCGHIGPQVAFAWHGHVDVADLAVVSLFAAAAGSRVFAASDSEIAASAHCFQGGENVLVCIFGGAAVMLARVPSDRHKHQA